MGKKYVTLLVPHATLPTEAPPKELPPVASTEAPDVIEPATLVTVQVLLGVASPWDSETLAGFTASVSASSDGPPPC